MNLKNQQKDATNKHKFECDKNLGMRYLQIKALLWPQQDPVKQQDKAEVKLNTKETRLTRISNHCASRCLRWLLLWLVFVPIVAAESPTSTLNALASLNQGPKTYAFLMEDVIAMQCGNPMNPHNSSPLTAVIPVCDDPCASCFLSQARKQVLHETVKPTLATLAIPQVTRVFGHGTWEPANVTCLHTVSNYSGNERAFADDDFLHCMTLIDPHIDIWPQIFACSVTMTCLVGRCIKTKKQKRRVKKARCKPRPQWGKWKPKYVKCRFVGKCRHRSARLKTRRKARKLFLQRRAWRFFRPQRISSHFNTQEQPDVPNSWSHFTQQYIKQMTSTRFDGGAAQNFFVPRRKRHKPQSTTNGNSNNEGEATRDVIAFLKQTLNNGVSMDQLLTALKNSIPSTNRKDKADKRRKKTKKQTSQTRQRNQDSQSHQNIQYWIDKHGNRKAYTVDETGWWTWLPTQKQTSAGTEDTFRPQTNADKHEYNGRDSKWISALRTADWNPCVPPKLISFQKLRNSLRDGKPIEGNVTEIWDKKTLHELETLWSSFEKKEGFTALLCGPAKLHTEETCHTRMSVCRGQYGQKLENVGLYKIGPGQGPWLPTSHKIDVKSIPKVERQTLRAAAPSFYRTPFIGTQANDSPTEVIKSLATLAGAPVSEFLGGKWTTQTSKHGTQLVVFLRLKKEFTAKLMSLSGQSGLFMTQVQPKTTEDFKPFWIDRTKNEADETYLRRILTMKNVRNQPVLFRFGPGNNLGFQKVESDKAPVKARLHVIHGVPRAWGEEDLTLFLTNQQWTDIRSISRKRQKWMFMATAPTEHAARTSWQYDAHDSDDPNIVTCSITVQVAVKTQSHPEVRTAIKAPRRVRTLQDFISSEAEYDPAHDEEVLKDVSGNHEDATASQAPNQSMTALHAQTPGARERSDHEKDKERTEKSRSRSPTREHVKPTQIDSPTPGERNSEQHSPQTIEQGPSKRAKVTEPSDPSQAIDLFGWKHWDQGGTGDCFYRVAAIFEKRQSEQPTQDESRRQGSWLRAQTCNHIHKHATRYQKLFQNKASFENWVKCAGQHNTWAEGTALQAFSEKFGRPVVIWEKKTDGASVVYTRFVIAPRFSQGFACGAKSAEPLCVQLCDKHYTALVPPNKTAFPSSWLRETPNVVVNLEGGGSDTHDNMSVATPSVHTMTSHKQLSHSVATPSVHSAAQHADAVSLKLIKDVATPSVHTRATAAKTIATKAPAALKTKTSQTQKIESRRNLPSVATQATFDPDVNNLLLDQLAECDFRPDTAPYPRHLKLDDVTLAKPQGPQVWVCPVPKCSHEIRIEAGPKARYKLQVAKSAHLKSRHTDKERAAVPRLGFSDRNHHSIPDLT